MSIRDKYLNEAADKFGVGDRVMVSHLADKTECIIAFLNNKKCCLIALDSGNRWADDAKVKNQSNITPDEMKKMTGGAPYMKKGI